MTKRIRRQVKAPTQSLQRMEQAAQDAMVQGMVQAYAKQMRLMNAEIVSFLRQAPGFNDLPYSASKDS
ncbi:MAG: hypothetical protein EOO40_03240 [Deltaproteobacteria bacterium]|nr:MAG: hypothetical protein EOO40_03240 [Deltaproteobacteria bacterium]